MIEDLENDFSSYTYENPGKKEPQQARPLAMFLVVFAVWVVFTVICLAVSLPKIKTTLEQTNAVEIWRNRKEYKKYAGTTKVSLFFINMSDGEAKLEEYSSYVKLTGETTFHDAIEGLLEGPSESAIQNGTFSFIAKNTKLNGLTVSGSSVFVDFSEEFLNSGENWGNMGLLLAKSQIIKTIKSIDSSISEVIFLVNGREI